jgi:UDPglucose 6-dehydrogenase
MAQLNITVVGTGYVGLVTGACLAARGHNVICVDTKQEVIEDLNQGKPHFFEPGLPELLREVLSTGRFQARTSLAAALKICDLVLVAVGTPSEGGRIDLSQVRSASLAIGAELPKRSKFVSVVVKSTVLPGTTDTQIRNWLEESSGMRLGEFGLGMNPEFLREGSALADFMEADRIVVGFEDSKTKALLETTYESWPCEKLFVNARTAEMVKYVNNCLLATQISAMNEFANLAGALGGIDMQDVLEGVSLDARWSPILTDGTRVRPGILKYLVPGCGFGGSCFPKDVQALRSYGKDSGCEMRLLEAVLDINASQPESLVDLWLRHVGELAGKKALVLGLAFKEGTDDIRESPSRIIIRRLRREGVSVIAHDPVAISVARRTWTESDVEFCDDWKSAIVSVDAIFIVTRWPEYSELEQSSNLAGKIVLDARRLLSPELVLGADYLTVGRRMPVGRTLPASYCASVQGAAQSE